MSRDLPAALALEVVKGELHPILLVEIGTADPAAPVRCWSGLGNLVWNGMTFIGTGLLGKISPLEETSDLKASGVVFELSGVPSAMLSVALSSIRQARAAKIWFCALQGRELVGEPYLIHRSLTDVPEIADEGDTVTIRISAENRLIDLERARLRRYTSEDQARTDPDDLGFEYVPSLQDAQLIWGRV